MTTCIECGDDDAVEGWPCCSECLETFYSDGPDADARLADAEAFARQIAAQHSTDAQTT